MGSLKPLDRPPSRPWSFVDGLVIGLVVGLCGSLALLFIPPAGTPDKCRLPLPARHAAIVANRQGDLISDVFSSVEEANSEAEKHNAGHFKNESASGRPFGWEPVVILRTKDYLKACR